MGLFDEVATALRRAGGVVMLTGADVSVGSGPRQFRGPGGWWKGGDRASMATPEASAADPALLTQIADGLHQRVSSERVVGLHGNLTIWCDHRSGRRVTPDPAP